MIHNMNERVAEYARRHLLHNRWNKVLAAMMCVVVFCTTYALILPAITLDRETVCGKEEHTHTATACYTQNLICTTDENEEHTHTDACYESVLSCDKYEHTHTDGCYKQEEEPAKDTELTGEEKQSDDTAASADKSKSDAVELTQQTVNATVYTDNTYGTEKTDSATITLEGNLPEGVAVKAYPVAAADINLNDTSKTVIDAYDIGLFVADKEYEPDGSVQVKIVSDKLNDVKSVDVYHIADGAGAVPEQVSTVDVADNTVKFDANAFSAYVLTTTAEETDAETPSDEASDKNTENTDNGTTEEPAEPADSETPTEPEQNDDAAANGAENSDGTANAALIDNGISMAQITGDKTVQEGSTVTLSCNSNNCSEGTWKSADEGIATVKASTDYWSSGKSATVTGVSAGTVEIKHTHKNRRGTTTTTNVEVTSAVQYAKVFYLKSPNSDPDSNDTTQWGSEVGYNAGKVNMKNATWVNNKNVFTKLPQHVVNMPSGFVKQDDGSYLMPKNQYQNYYQEVVSYWGTEWDIDSIDDVDAIYLTPYKISTNADGMHIDCTVSVKTKTTYNVKFWVVYPNGTIRQLDSYTQYMPQDGSNPSISETEKPHENSYTYNGDTYVFDGWYPESGYNNTTGDFSGDKVTWSHNATNSELSDGTVNFYAHYVKPTNNLTIVKHEAGDTDTKLANASFSLSNSSNAYSGTTNKNGEVTISGVPYGTYTLTETSAPDGYKAFSDGITVTVGETITVNSTNSWNATIGEDGKLYVPNEVAKLDFTIKKVSSENGTTLSGATFTLTGDGIDEKTVTTNANGTYTFEGIPVGEYTLTETEAPAGYNLLTDKINLTVTSTGITATYGSGNSTNMVEVDKDTNTITVKNSAGTALPNTGGPGTRMYTLSGILLTAIAAAGCLIYSGKKRKNEKGGVKFGK